MIEQQTLGVGEQRGWELDHYAHAVKDLDESIAFYQGVLGLSLDSREVLAEHQVEVAFFKLANALIELISPLPTNQTLSKFIADKGEGLHHVCFKVEDLQGELDRLERQGVALIDKRPRPGARNTMVAFVHPKSTHRALIELCTDK